MSTQMIVNNDYAGLLTTMTIGIRRFGAVVHAVLLSLLLCTLARSVPAQDLLTEDWSITALPLTNGLLAPDDMAAGTNGIFYVSGQYSQGYARDLVLSAVSTTGGTEWVQLWGSGALDRNCLVRNDGAGRLYVTAKWNMAQDNDNVKAELYLRCFETNGTSVWTQTWGPTGALDDATTDGIALWGTNRIYVVGGTEAGFDGQPYTGGLLGQPCLSAFDREGNRLWSRLWGGSAQVQSLDLVADVSGSVYVVGSAYGSFDGQTSYGQWDWWLTKFDPDGSKQWTRQWGGSGYDGNSGIHIATADMDIFVAVDTYDLGGVNRRWVVSRIRPDGTRIECDPADFVRGLIPETDNTALVLDGNTFLQYGADGHIWLKQPFPNLSGAIMRPAPGNGIVVAGSAAVPVPEGGTAQGYVLTHFSRTRPMGPLIRIVDIAPGPSGVRLVWQSDRSNLLFMVENSTGDLCVPDWQPAQPIQQWWATAASATVTASGVSAEFYRIRASEP